MIILILIITFIGIIFYLYSRFVETDDDEDDDTPEIDQKTPAELVMEQSYATVWTIPDQELNCNLYYQPPVLINDVPVFSKPPVTPINLDNFIQTPNSTCILEGGTSYSLVNRICTGNTDAKHNFCVKLDGTLAQIGETETVYSNFKCEIPNFCPGYLAILTHINPLISFQQYCLRASNNTLTACNRAQAINMNFYYYVTKFNVNINSYMKEGVYLYDVPNGLYIDGQNVYSLSEIFLEGDCNYTLNIGLFGYSSEPKTIYILESLTIINEGMPAEVRDFLIDIKNSLINAGFIPGETTLEDMTDYIDNLNVLKKNSLFKTIRKDQERYQEILKEGVIIKMPQTLISPPSNIDPSWINNVPNNPTDLFNFLRINQFAGTCFIRSNDILRAGIIDGIRQCQLNIFDTRIIPIELLNDVLF